MTLDQVIIKEREDKIRSLNLDPDELLRKLPSTQLPSIERIDEAVEYLKKELDFSNKQFQISPSLLGCSIEDNIKPKVEYYRNELSFDNKQFQKLPALLTYSLEKRIKPRTEFLRIKQRNIPSNFLSSGDELFCKNLAKCPLEEYESFKEDYLKK